MLLSASIQSASDRARLLGLGDRLGNELRIAAEPLGLLDELAALDLEDLHPAAAFVISRGHLEWGHQATEAEVLDLLEALFDILSGRLAAAIGFECIAGRLDMHGSPQEPTVVHDRVIHRLGRLPALRLQHRPDLVTDGIVVTDAGEGHRVIAFGYSPAARSHDVMFARGPDQGEHLGQREAVALEFLNRDGRRSAEQVVDHEIGPVALRDIEDLRAHLDPGRRHGKRPQLEPFDFLQVFDDRDRLAACWVVIKDVGDLLALETAAELLLDELDGRGALRPIGRSYREQIRKTLTVGRGGNAKTRRGAGDLVLAQLLVQRLNLWRAVDHDRSRTFPLLALIGLNRRRHFVLVVDFQVFDLIALDPALRIDQVIIVLECRANPRAVDLRRPGAVAHPANDHFLLLRSRNPGETQPGHRAGRDRQCDPR